MQSIQTAENSKAEKVSILSSFPPSHMTAVIQSSQLLWNRLRPPPAHMPSWKALDYVRTQTLMPGHTCRVTWAEGPTYIEPTPRCQLLKCSWLRGRGGALWESRECRGLACGPGWQIPQTVRAHLSCPPLGPTFQSSASPSAQELWKDHGSTERTVGSSLSGLARRSGISATVGAAQLRGGLEGKAEGS